MRLIKGPLSLCVFKLLGLSSILGSVMSINFRSIFFYVSIFRGVTMSKDKDPLEELGGPMTRSRAKKAKEALQQVLSILCEYKPKFEGEKTKVVNCIAAQMEED